MNRRDTVLAMFALGAAPSTLLAQKRTVRIGALSPRKNSVILPPILNRLAQLGYVEGRNLELIYRSADGLPERFPALARELIEAKCNLIFALGAEAAARALVDAKSSIPVVLIAADYDPLRAGLVSNLRRPGGLVTGVVGETLALSAKRLEVMREILPKVNRFLVLSDNFTKSQLEFSAEAARALRVELVIESFGTPPYDFEAAFAKGRSAQAGALIVLTSPEFLNQRDKIYDLAMKHRLPASSPANSYGDRGILFYYGADLDKQSVRAGDIAASILGGKPPADIPIELPTHITLTINLKTAKALGITVPKSVLVRADQVIE